MLRDKNYSTLAAALLGCAMALTPGGAARADAIVTLTGPDASADVNAGSIDLAATTTLWGLLGGTATGAATSTVATAAGTTITYGGISAFTPTGDNSDNNNPILRDFLVVTGAGGQQSVVSLGEIDPRFAGATASNDVLISVIGNTASLSFTGGGGSAGRDITDISNIALYAVPALPTTPLTVSSSLNLAGAVADPGSKDLAALKAAPGQTTETVNGDTYTGPLAFDLIDSIDLDVLNQYVVAAGTDGFEVVYALADLDNALDGNAMDIVPYQDTKGQLSNGTTPGTASLARLITPNDTPFAHGRWASNIDSIDDVEVPEPTSLPTFAAGLVAFGLLFGARRLNKRA